MNWEGGKEVGLGEDWKAHPEMGLPVTAACVEAERAASQSTIRDKEVINHILPYDT